MVTLVVRTGGVLAAAAIAVVAADAHPSGQAAACGVRDLLARSGFSAREVADIERERPVARVLGTDRRQVAVIGGVKIRAPRELLAARVRTIDYLKGGRQHPPRRAVRPRAVPGRSRPAALRGVRPRRAHLPRG